MNRFLTNSGTKFGVIVGISTILGISSSTLIPNNHVGHEHFLGKISEKQLTEGLHFVNPFSSIIKIPLTMVKNSYNIEVITKERYKGMLSFDVLFNIDKNLARELYIKYNGNHNKVLIDSIIESTVQDISLKYKYEELTDFNHKSEIFNEISKKLRPFGIIIQNII